MNEDGKNEIQRLKKELDHAKKALIKWDSLLLKREELESQIDKMHTEHRKPDEIKLFKIRLRELDTLLDHLEEHSPEKIENLENQLIARILDLHPELQKEYDEFQQALEQEETKYKNLQTLDKGLNSINELLQGALNARQKIRRKGILSYIFGTNPNQKISQHLHAIHEEIGTLLPWLDELGYDPDFSDFFIELQRECKERWGFRKIDTFFKQAHESLRNFREKVDEQIKDCELNKKNLRQRREDWILRS